GDNLFNDLVDTPCDIDHPNVFPFTGHSKERLIPPVTVGNHPHRASLQAALWRVQPWQTQRGIAHYVGRRQPGLAQALVREPTANGPNLAWAPIDGDIFRNESRAPDNRLRIRTR